MGGVEVLGRDYSEGLANERAIGGLRQFQAHVPVHGLTVIVETAECRSSHYEPSKSGDHY